MACRYVRAASAVSSTPSLRSTRLFGIQTPPPERAVEPPKCAAFSMTTARRPCRAAVRAAVMPAAPLPTTTTSYSSSTMWNRL